MRNLHDYPINNKDRHDVLIRLREEYHAEMTSRARGHIPIGDMTGAVLDDLIEMFT